MAEALKHTFNKKFLERLGDLLKDNDKSFDAKPVKKLASTSLWEGLELKERMRATTLSIEKGFDSTKSYHDKIKILSLVCPNFSGLQGMTFPDYVEVFGQDDWEASMMALKDFTRYSTSEFAIRPFIELKPQKAMSLLREWIKDSNEHVRRLCSEGSRPLLPWSFQLRFLREDPKEIRAILKELCDDSSEYVRKSVANNLNDISKDHPELAKAWAKEFLDKGALRKTVRHGLRTLLKNDDLEALKIVGIKPLTLDQTRLEIQTRDLLVGETLDLSFSFKLRKKALLRISYAITFKHKKYLSWHRKVFHLKEAEHEKGEHQLKKSHSFKVISTRRYYPGLHRIDIIVNGKSYGQEVFCLSDDSSAWILYIAESEKGTLYTGVTNNLQRRERQHRGEIKGGSKYLRAQSFKKFVYFEAGLTKSEALKREAQVKKLSKDKKWKMIQSSSISPS